MRMPQQSNPMFEQLGALLGLAQQAQALEAGPAQTELFQARAANERQQAQQGAAMAPFQLNEARFQDAHRQEAYDQGQQFNQAKMAGMIPDAAYMQMDPSTLNKLLADKFGIGTFDPAENARQFLMQNFPNLSNMFKPQAPK